MIKLFSEPMISPCRLKRALAGYLFVKTDQRLSIRELFHPPNISFSHLVVFDPIQYDSWFAKL